MSHQRRPVDLAPEIGIDQPGSFGRDVFHVRHPKLLAQILATIPYPARTAAALADLLAESQHGAVHPLRGPGPDVELWEDWMASWVGKLWREVPFLAAESYFYRRLLEAIDFFDLTSPWAGIDPFAPAKAAELADPGLTGHLHAYDQLDDLSTTARTEALLHASLWGNRADLGFRITHNDNGIDGTVLVDQSPLIAEFLSTRPGTVIVVADNAGRELVSDLLLIDHLLTNLGVGRVIVHFKAHPYYVSDATTADLLACIHRISQTPGAPARAAARLGAALRESRLEPRTHPFSTAPLPYQQMPDDLAADFASAHLVIFKGDLQYRRLIGDRHWPAHTSLAELTDYLPPAVKFAALRTLKSEVAAGIDHATLLNLEAVDGWRTSGRYGVIQARL